MGWVVRPMVRRTRRNLARRLLNADNSSGKLGL